MAEITIECASSSFCCVDWQCPAPKWLIHHNRLLDVNFEFLLHQISELLVDLGRCEPVRLLWEHILPASESFGSIQVPNTLIEVVQPPIAVGHQQIGVLDELKVQLLGSDLLCLLEHWFVLRISCIASKISELSECMLCLVCDQLKSRKGLLVLAKLELAEA